MSQSRRHHERDASSFRGEKPRNPQGREQSKGRAKVAVMLQRAEGPGIRRRSSTRTRPSARSCTKIPSSASASSRTTTTARRKARLTITARHGRSTARREGETAMSDWQLLEPASAGETGQGEESPRLQAHARRRARVQRRRPAFPQPRRSDASHPHRRHQYGEGQAVQVRAGLIVSDG